MGSARAWTRRVWVRHVRGVVSAASLGHTRSHRGAAKWAAARHAPLKQGRRTEHIKWSTSIPSVTRVPTCRRQPAASPQEQPQVKSQTDRGQASKACLGLVCFSKSHRGQDTSSTHLPLVRVSTNYSLCLLDRGLLQICITHLYPSWLLHIHIKDDAHTRLRSKDKAQSVPECSPRTVSRPVTGTSNVQRGSGSSLERRDRG